jgi:carbonic anhydrase/acetyltransferase-like protein (isoleucine patch superfamily)
MNPLHALVRLRAGIASRVRNLWFRALGVNLLGYVWLRGISIPRNWGDITLEKGTALDDGVVLLCSGPPRPNKLLIRGAYVNRFTMLDAHERIEIGAHCMIGPNCYITDADHGMALGLLVGEQAMNTKPVVIQDGVWLGAGVVVLKGVTIGSNAVVGAGAVVTKDVPPDMKVAGVPARMIGKRAEYEHSRPDTVCF